MRIGKRLFPYPVINNDKYYSTFENSNFEISYELHQVNDKLILKDLYYELDNHYINQLILSGEAKVVCVIECSSTVYRKTFELSDKPTDLELDLSNFRDRVVISGYAYTTDDIISYSDVDFEEDFQEYQFVVEKYSIIAIDDGATTKIVYDEEDDNKVSSIFLVLKSQDNDLNHIVTELTSKKIQITVRESEFDIYERLKGQSSLRNTFFSFFIIPSLVFALENLKSIEDFVSILFKYDWFSSIKNAYKKQTNKELDEEEFDQTSTIEIAQIVMSSPINEAVQDIFKMAVSGMREGEDDDE